MKKAMLVVTDYLFPKSDFITGLGSVFNLPGNYYDINTSNSAEEADMRAIQNDWMMVGKDMSMAKNKFDSENNIEEPVLCEENY